MAVSIVYKDSIIYSKGFGYSDLENKINVDSATLFPIGSATKAFTALLIGQLEYEGLIDINKNPTNYLNGFSFSTSELNTDLTIENMLCHTSGMPRHDFSWYLFENKSERTLMQKIKYHQPNHKPGTTYQYNNMMYFLLGQIIGEITGSDWHSQIKSNILDKLEMNNSVTKMQDFLSVPNIAKGYHSLPGDSSELMEYFKLDLLAPAGGVMSNATDMSKWLKAWLNRDENTDVFPEEFSNAAISPQSIEAKGIRNFNTYGFGWSVSMSGVEYMVEHGGNIDGFSSSVCFYPRKDLGISILVNQNYSPVPYIARNIISDYFLERVKADWLKNYKNIADKSSDNSETKSKSYKKDGEEDRTDGGEDKTNKNNNKKDDFIKSENNLKPKTHKIQDYTGDYVNPGYGKLQISNSGDSIFASTKIKKLYLKHLNYNTFEPYLVEKNEIDKTSFGSFKIKFNIDNSGNIDKLFADLEPNLEPLSFEKTFSLSDIDEVFINLVSGKYTHEAGYKATIYKKNDEFRMDVPGQGTYYLQPIKENNFKIKDLEGYWLEFEIIDGKSEAVILHQPNGVFRVEKEE
jgi:CubicO group peptidase (beta-lactamase class C family)